MKILSLFLLALLFVSCYRSYPIPYAPIEEFSGITRTDVYGNVLGAGDTTDWLPKMKMIDLSYDSIFIGQDGKPDTIPIVSENYDTTNVIYGQPAFPNPFANSITIKFILSVDADVTIKLMDHPGDIVWQTTLEGEGMGTHSLMLKQANGIGLNQPGIYRVYISAKALVGGKTNETYGDIQYAP